MKGFFHNPNIHPLIEFRRRLKAVKTLRDSLKLDIECSENYGLREFLRAVAGSEDERCRICYSLRFDAACARAKELGIPSVTTTLFASPHQDHDLLETVGREAAARHGVEFLRRDFRPGHSGAREKAQKMKLYKQQYCGCIFSEYERYVDTDIHLYRGDRP